MKPEIVFTTLLDEPSITEMVPSSEFATYTRLAFSSTAMSHGVLPTGIVAATLSSPPTTVTSSLEKLAKYTYPVFRFTAAASGPVPEGSVTITLPLLRSATEMVFSNSLPAYRRPVLVLTATAHGFWPTAMLDTALLLLAPPPPHA